MMLKSQGEDTYVYDLDTMLTFPCHFARYMQEALGADFCLKQQFHRYEFNLFFQLCTDTENLY